MLQERINPFDKNKAPVVADNSKPLPSVINLYSTPSSTLVSSSSITTTYNTTILPTSKVIDVASKPSSASVTSSIISSGFDYSYKPTSTTTSSFIPTSYSTQKSVDKEEVDEPKAAINPSLDETTSSPARVRGKFERKLSDADIIFGGKTDPYISSTFNNSYSRNRSNSSFTSTSTDSEYNTTSRDAAMKRENPFQKSLSVSSEKDGDFASDPRVRSYQGITNSAFQDSFDSPKASSISKPWSNKHDEDFDLK